MYQPGHQVIVADDDGCPRAGRVLGAGHRYCETCHCTPVDPDHAIDASLCCPGPWYRVQFIDDVLDKPSSYAEHAIQIA